MSRNRLSPKSIYFGLLIALVVCALAPSNVITNSATSLRGPLIAVLAPVSGSAAFISTRIRPPQSERQTSENELASDEQYQELLRKYQASIQQIRAMQQVIDSLQAVAPYGVEGEFRRIVASRIGADLRAGTIEVRAGEREGVVPASSVATAQSEPLQIVGLVSQVNWLTSVVHLITDRKFEPSLIEAVIIPDDLTDEEALARAPRCQLRPRGDGLLVGEDVPADDVRSVEKGHMVHLSDAAWPAAAQMLIVGRVERIEETELPLFRRVLVKPLVDVSRARQVIIRVPVSGSAQNGGGIAP